MLGGIGGREQSRQKPGRKGQEKQAVGQSCRMRWRQEQKLCGGSWRLVQGKEKAVWGWDSPMKDSHRIYFIVYTKAAATLMPSLLRFVFSKQLWSLPSKNVHTLHVLLTLWPLEGQTIYPIICSFGTGSSDLSTQPRWLQIRVVPLNFFWFPSPCHLVFFNYEVPLKTKQIKNA